MPSNLLKKHRSKLYFVAKCAVSLFLLLYFIKFGSSIDISPDVTTRALVQAVLYAALVIVFLFAAHFAAGINFNIKVIGLFVFSAVAGTVIGIVLHHFTNLTLMH